MFSNIFFLENRAVYEMWKKKKNSVEWGRSHNTIWRMRISCYITKAIDTHIHIHIHTLRLRNTYCISTTTVAPSRPKATLYVHCLCSFPEHFPRIAVTIFYSDSHHFQVGHLYEVQTMDAQILRATSSGWRLIIVGAQYGTCFKSSPLWLLEFWRGCCVDNFKICSTRAIKQLVIFLMFRIKELQPMLWGRPEHVIA